MNRMSRTPDGRLVQLRPVRLYRLTQPRVAQPHAQTHAQMTQPRAAAPNAASQSASTATQETLGCHGQLAARAQLLHWRTSRQWHPTRGDSPAMAGTERILPKIEANEFCINPSYQHHYPRLSHYPLRRRGHCMGHVGPF